MSAWKLGWGLGVEEDFDSDFELRVWAWWMNEIWLVVIQDFWFLCRVISGQWSLIIDRFKERVGMGLCLFGRSMCCRYEISVMSISHICILDSEICCLIIQMTRGSWIHLSEKHSGAESPPRADRYPGLPIRKSIATTCHRYQRTTTINSFKQTSNQPSKQATKMESSETSGIPFSTSHTQQSFKLLELPPELLSLLESPNPPKSVHTTYTCTTNNNPYNSVLTP